jgi:hypothetical protein
MKSIMMLRRKDTAVSISGGALLYMLSCCVQASLSTVCIGIYNLNRLQAGLVYLPFGIGCSISTLISSKWIDHDYAVVARSHGLPVDKTSTNNLRNFPIEEARMRSIFAPAFGSIASVIGYGWAVSSHTVR